MRRKLIAALTTRFEGVEAKTLGRIADKILASKTIESDEDVNSAVEEVTFAEILKSYGDSRAAEATKSAVSNYEKKHGLKDGKPAGQTEDDDADDDADDDSDDEPDGEGKEGQKKQKSGAKKTTPKNPELAEIMKAMKTMTSTITSLNEEITAMKKGKVAESRKSRLSEIIKNLRDSQKKAYSRIPLDGYTDEEFESFLEEVTTEAEEMEQENKADGGGFSAPFGGGTGKTGKKTEGEASADEVSEVAELLNL